MNPKREGNGKVTGRQAPAIRSNLRVVRPVSWSDIADDTIADIVRLVAGYGAAVMFGVTSDQGAYSILVLDNQNKIKEYPHDTDEVHNLYTWLRDEYFGVGGKPAT